MTGGEQDGDQQQASVHIIMVGEWFVHPGYTDHPEVFRVTLWAENTCQSKVGGKEYPVTRGQGISQLVRCGTGLDAGGNVGKMSPVSVNECDSSLDQPSGQQAIVGQTGGARVGAIGFEDMFRLLRDIQCPCGG